MNQVRRLSKREESVLHQEILIILNAQHEKMKVDKFRTLTALASNKYPNIMRSLRDSEIQDTLCSEWGRINAT